MGLGSVMDSLGARRSLKNHRYPTVLCQRDLRSPENSNLTASPPVVQDLEQKPVCARIRRHYVQLAVSDTL